MSDIQIDELCRVAKELAKPGKGLLAADESTGTIKKRFDDVGVENTESMRSSYRNLLFQTKGLGQYISGTILFEETLFQKNAEGTPMVDLLQREGILPGIKVDKGVVDLPFTDQEKSTQGLDGLAARCQDYYKAGARFAKWRAVLTIDKEKGKPSAMCIHESAHTLARYAAICQASNLVPVVEPEILTDGSHGIEHCGKVTEAVLTAVFQALKDHKVVLEAMILKPNMVTPGSTCPKKATPKEVAEHTVRILKRCVPSAVPGIMFLSGGQSEEEASMNLNAMNSMEEKHHPWALSFSYGRALQASCLKTWRGKSENRDAAQAVVLRRAKANSDAQFGRYKQE